MRILPWRIGFVLLLIAAVFSGACRARPDGAQPVEDPLAEAARYRAQADKGDADAQYRVAVLYADGQAVAQDDDLAVRYLQRAADQGHAGAQYRLAVMYDSGRGVARDVAEASRLYRQAAERGDTRAQYKLGLSYDKERGAARDVTEALKWYRMAAEHGHAAAASEIVALRKPQRELVAPAKPTFAVARLRQPLIPKLERLEVVASGAYAAVVGGSTGSGRDVDAAWKKYVAAEQSLQDTLEAAWREVPFTRNLPVLVSDPLTLAMLDLQIEVRRRSDGNEHTEVPALSKDPGCKGDLVQDRLIYRYGFAVADPQVSSTGSETVTKRLDDMARQIACLSVRQIGQVERAVSFGFVATAARMKKNGFATLVPAFARLVAPVQLLIFDARKHRGERAPSWYWFRKFRPMLQRAVAASGWASNGTVYVWDRRGAFLIGFSPCGPGVTPPNCVDIRKLLDSLSDPRAIGLGDCALAGMIAEGPDKIDGQDRYTCPSMSCTPDPDPQRDRQAIDDLRRKAAQTWPSTPPRDLVPDRQTGSGRACRLGDGLTFQTALNVIDQCIAEIFNQAPNPWDTYAACTAQAIGAGDREPPEVAASLPGVPMGRGCGLFDEGGDEEPGFLSKIWDAIFGPEEVPTYPSGQANSDGSVDIKTSSGLTFHFEKGREQPTRDKISISEQDLKEARRGLIDLHWGRLTTADGKFIESKAIDVVGADPDSGWLAGLDKTSPRDCADPAGCANACTGMGAQIAAVSQCTDDLFNTFAEALGRPRGQLPPSGKPRGIVSIWDPDRAPIDEGKVSACQIPTGDAPARQANECGVVYCSNAVDGLAAPGAGGNCCGSVNPLAITQRACIKVDCGPDQILGNNCECVPIGGEVPPDRPPLPTGRGSDSRRVPPPR